MEEWSAHQLFKEAAETLGQDAAADLRSYADLLMSRGVAVVFSLGYLAKITQIDYQVLRDSVNRKREVANYRMFAIRKRSGGRRFIHSVCSDLFRVQQFVNQEILQKTEPHSSSFAFHPKGGIRACAAKHCGAKWLFQFDLADFFYDITEVDAFRAFQALGYRTLLAFEFARLCTTTHLPVGKGRYLVRYRGAVSVHFRKASLSDAEGDVPYAPQIGRMGVLPQGAPTSPMLSNLAAANLDFSLSRFAAKNGFVYTRYADDITISASNLPGLMSIGRIQGNIVKIIRQSGFKENGKKTRIAGPGSRKVVLGLLVDGVEPRLSRETYKRVDRHLYASEKFGLEDTALHEGFDSAYGFHNHLSGLIAFVKDVDLRKWESLNGRLRKIPLPWIDAL